MGAEMGADGLENVFDGKHADCESNPEGSTVDTSKELRKRTLRTRTS